ncbi:MAG: family 20 glycosylhydrolase [Bacteroidales bacterium]|nr:family 20 glycosylhydrolase [Bacteroidales bacterium]
MKHRNAKLLSTLVALISMVSCARPCCAVWTEGDTDDETGRTLYTMEIQNPPAGTDWAVLFNQFIEPIDIQEGSQGTIEFVRGTLYVLRPVEDTGGKTLTVRYLSRPLLSQGRAPEAFYLQIGADKPVEIPFSHNFQPVEDVTSFEYTPVEIGITDMIPQLKSVTCLEGSTTLNPQAAVEYVEGHTPGWYRITIAQDTRIEAADGDGAYYAANTIGKLIENAGGVQMPAMVIEDWPDLLHRGVMLDVSRNFTGKEGVLRLIDLLARYKANILHLHLADDEGWRLEIDGLPELTSYGAFRAVPTLNPDGSLSETEGLQIAYSATSGRDDADAPGNGYYSRADFIEILKYAKERHIYVIPEFDTPGHSRAAIKSMEKRAELTGDASYILSDPQDTSVYHSAQDYYDNALNVALPSAYKFVGTVFDSVISTYKEAGATLLAIHVGGDEVPDGAWEGSPVCRALMEENGWTDVRELKDYYVNRVARIAGEKGVKIAGWQELCQDLKDDTFELLKKNLYASGFWKLSRNRDALGYKLANDGVNVIIGCAPNAYLDFSYNYSKKERGLCWGGHVDERRSFSLQPYDLYRSVRWDDYGKMLDISDSGEDKLQLTPEGKSRITGVQGQLWAETIRNFDHVTYYIFPKALGLLERGWNSEPSWAGTRTSDDPAFVEAFDKFYSIITNCEMPYYEKEGICYHKN